jgi:patatin-related protein
MHDQNDPVQYGAEVRFGVVMYGGVSLAIYINGVTNEMFELVRATQASALASGNGGGESLASRDIYARLSRLVNNEALRASYAQKLTTRSACEDVWPALAAQVKAFDRSANRVELPTRFVIDVISGTSAGGINGIFLAKALANNEDFGLLQELWVEEGDIGLLLNDERSYAQGLGTPLTPRGDQPKSLLNSDRMYTKLLEAMQRMSIRAHNEPTRSPIVDEIDLFVTTTDIAGTRVSLKLFDKVVQEKRHKQSFHFRRGDGVDDFHCANDPFLAFTARCTSSFPFAFEPMTLQAIVDMQAAEQKNLSAWNGFFSGLSRQEVSEARHVGRAFGDGGYLDNKPFSYVVNQLAERSADLPIERKLIYVEPSPEVVPANAGPGTPPPPAPNAIENALAALTSIPQYETIREDLESVLHRNRTVERIERIVRLGELDLEQEAQKGNLFARVVHVGDKIPAWKELPMSGMIKYYGRAFAPYFRLRVVTTTDTLAQALAARWAIDRASSQYQGLRTLVRAWRDRRYSDEADKPGQETNNAFLADYDLDYRWRRLGLLLRKIDQAARVASSYSSADNRTLAPEDASVRHRIEARLDHQLWIEEHEATLAALQCMKKQLVLLRGEIAKERKARLTELLVSQLPEARQSELLMVLGVASGDDPAGKQLQSVDGRMIPLVLNERLLQEAAASRGTQQAMYSRVNAILKAADDAGIRTKLQETLESGVQSLQLVRSSLDGAMAQSTRVLWQLLGRPRLAVQSRNSPAGEMQIHSDTESDPQDAQQDETADAKGAEAQVVVKIAAALSVQDTALKLDASCRELLDSRAGQRVRHFLSEYYLQFDSFDQISFPLYYDSGAGEPALVDVVRVSPRDATNLVDESTGQRKLAGTTLANFGAFLDKRWRENDILWGRLDGAERLIHSLLPMKDDATTRVREELTNLAQQAILRETLLAAGMHDMLAGMRRALQQKDPERLKELTPTLDSLLAESKLMDHMRRHKVDPSPDPQATLNNIARGVTVTGKLLEGVAKDAGGKGATSARWLARIGLFFQGLVLVSLPQTWRHNWARLGVCVLYAIEVVLLLLGFVLGSQDVRMLAIAAFGVTVAVHLLSAILHDFALRRWRWLGFTVVGLSAALLLLAALGGFGVFWLTSCREALAGEAAPTKPALCAKLAYLVAALR